jgi:PAS domain S-box-containing protein
MAMRRLHSLRSRLILILGTFLALTLGTLGFLINDFSQRAIAEQTQSREELFAHNVQLSVNQVLFAGKYQAQAYLEALAEREPTVRYLAIVDGATGRVLAHSDPSWIGQTLTDPAAEGARAVLTSGSLVEQAYTAADGVPIHDWALPYERGYLREREGIIRIGLSGEREAALRAQSRIYTLALILLFMGAGLALAVALSIRVTAGLRGLTAAALRFGAGRYDTLVPVPEPPRDELDQLGAAFNQMATQLGGYAARLESQVAERTAQLDAANRQLRESESRLRGFIDNAIAMIYLKDVQGRYLLVNTAWADQVGLTPAQMLGRTDAELLLSDAADICHASDAVVIRSGESQTFEETIPMLDGMHTYLTVKFPLRDEHGAVYAVGGVSTDISERKRLESELRVQYEKLQQLDHLKNEFVNAVSHDLRTPLTSILGYAEFLEDEIGGPLTPEQKDFVLQIQLGTRRLETLVDDLLDFARIEAGTFRLRLASVDLREPAHEIVDSLRPQAEDARLTLGFDVPETPLEVVMDARRIQQVLTNLVHNALKFTPPGGTITVRLRGEGAWVRGEVEDTGPGITPEDVPRLFQRFSQLQRGMAKGGTGLGLAISKSIVEAHGGQIGVTSQPGQGSTFWFTLPVQGPAEGSLEEPRHQEA